MTFFLKTGWKVEIWAWRSGFSSVYRRLKRSSLGLQMTLFYFDDFVSGRRKNRGSTESTSPASPTTKRICRNWAREGSCRFGERCHFEHDRKPADHKQKARICTEFSKGSCRYNERCHFRHVLQDPKNQDSSKPRLTHHSVPARKNELINNLCLVCREESKAVTLKPCGHMCICELCIDIVQECPECYVKTTGKMN